jgi:hypothetical protein
MLRRTIAAIVLLAACAASAEEGGLIAPLPAIVVDTGQQRITPERENDNETPAILTTRKAEPKPDAPAPMKMPSPAPFGKSSQVPAAEQPATAKASSYLPDKVPFGRATPVGPEIPSAPHNTVATPVVDVDSVEVSEPAPPTPVAPEADPATQSPEEPTALTSPIFDSVSDSGAPRKIVVRVLNKVTTQSSIFKASPREMVKFGRLEITATMCRVSTPNSQPDSAALLDIYEQLPGGKEKKPLFKGWMYASSPSIAALEHPIYDVTMVDCDIATPAPKPTEKPQKKAEKKGKK